MKIAFQDTHLPLDETVQICDALNELNIDIISFGVIPFTTAVAVNNVWTEPTVMMGSTKLVKLYLAGLLPEYGIIFYDKQKFDQAYYVQFLKSELLNGNAKFVKYGSVKDKLIHRPCFIKPSSDLKYFAGKVLYRMDNTISSELESECMIDCDLTDNASVLINEQLIDNILFEYRTFVVDNKIVDCSQYIKMGKVLPEVVADDVRDEIYQYINKIQRIYAPHDHYVIDVAKLDTGELKIVEYNCINCSGIYANDRALIYKTLMLLNN
jgi:hypothetical protein